MLRTAASITIVCFMAVAILGNGCGLICLQMCQAEKDMVAEQPEESGCGGCCKSQKSCGRMAEADKVKEPKPICGMVSCPEEKSEKSDCGTCVKPHLESTQAEKRIEMPDLILAGTERFSYKIEDKELYPIKDNTWYQVLHPTIASTVLLC